MDIKTFIKDANEEYVKMKSDLEVERKTLSEALKKAEDALNNERERFRAEEKELLSVLDATKKERIGEIERIATEKMDILKAEKDKIINSEASRRQNVENAYKDRFEGLESEHNERLEELKRRYETRKNLAKREYEELRQDLESSSAVHGDMDAMLASQQNRDLLEKIDEIEDRNVLLRASIKEELESYSEKLTEYLNLKDFTFEPPSKKDLLERANRYYESLDELNVYKAKLQKSQGCDALVEYNKATLEEAKKEFEKSLQEIDEWYLQELEGENRKYTKEKNILENQKNNSDVEKPEIAERIAQIDKELKEIEESLIAESGKIMEDLSKSEGAKTRMFNMIKAEELRVQEEGLQKAKERLDEFVKSQDKRLEDLLNRIKKDLQEIIGSGKDFSVGQIRDGRVRTALPKSIAIGRCGTTLAQCELVERLYGKSGLEIPATVSVDVLGGEALIFTSDNEEYLDRIMGGITLKFLEEFPKESLGVRIISSEREIFNSIASGIAENEKSTIINKDPHPALTFADAESNRIASKLGGEIKNAFDLYEKEKGRVITLVVIRDGIEEILGDKEMLAILRKLLSERGRNSGIRFIIACKNTEELKDLYESGLSISIKGEDVLYGEEKIDICTIPNQDISFFIKGVFSDIASLNEGFAGGDIPLASYCASLDELDKTEKEAKKNQVNKAFSIDGRITYEDLGFNSPFEEMGEEFDLPIGATENGIATISFDCGNKGGQNTGGLVVGATATGKSSLLNSLVVEGCKKYSPKDLELWLLDFKKEGAVNGYVDSKIPHIKVLKQGANEDDIYYILSNLCVEIERRRDLFEATGAGIRQEKFKNVFEYNEFVRKNDGYGDTLPRIVLIVDEVQELFQNKENSLIAEIMTMLATITVRGRCMGIHTVMIGNGICPDDFAFRNAYINHIKCKVSFRMSEGALREAQLGKEFEEISQEISTLQPGQMYVSLGNNIVKAKTPYVNSQCLEEYLEEIRKNFKNVENSKNDYSWFMKNPIYSQEGTSLVIGECFYTGKPVYATFNDKRSSLAVLSKNEDVQSRILSSILIGVSEVKGARALCCNGASIYEALFHNTIKERAGLSVRGYEKTDFAEMIKDAYSELVSRQNSNQKNDAPLFVIINGLSRLTQLDGRISNNEGPRFASSSIDNILGNKMGFVVSQPQDHNISVRQACQDLITQGTEVGIYVVISADSIENCTELVSKCQDVVATNDILEDFDLEGCGLGRLVPFLSKIEKDEHESVIFTRGNSIDKIKPIIFG